MSKLDEYTQGFNKISQFNQSVGTGGRTLAEAFDGIATGLGAFQGFPGVVDFNNGIRRANGNRAMTDAARTAQERAQAEGRGQPYGNNAHPIYNSPSNSGYTPSSNGSTYSPAMQNLFIEAANAGKAVARNDAAAANAHTANFLAIAETFKGSDGKIRLESGSMSLGNSSVSTVAGAAGAVFNSTADLMDRLNTFTFPALGLRPMPLMQAPALAVLQSGTAMPAPAPSAPTPAPSAPAPAPAPAPSAPAAAPAQKSTSEAPAAKPTYAKTYDNVPEVKMTADQVKAIQVALIAKDGPEADAMIARNGADEKLGKATFAALKKHGLEDFDFTKVPPGQIADLVRNGPAAYARAQAEAGRVNLPVAAAAAKDEAPVVTNSLADSPVSPLGGVMTEKASALLFSPDPFIQSIAQITEDVAHRRNPFAAILENAGVKPQDLAIGKDAQQAGPEQAAPLPTSALNTAAKGAVIG